MAEGGAFVVGALHLGAVVRAPHLPGRDETVTGSGIADVFGGKGGNQAVAAARHGAHAAMVGRVGDDDFAPRLLAFLDAAGVDRTRVQQGAGASGMSVAIVEDGGDYGAVIVSAANLGIDAAAIAIQPDARLLLQDEIPEAVNIAMAQAARARGITVMLNAAPMRAMDPALLAAVDLLVVNSAEVAALAGQPVAGPDEALAVARALARARRGAIVTLGAAGLTCCAEGAAWALPAFPVTAVSAHGAGDVFLRALAARLARGEGLARALAYAQAAAALHVARGPEGRLGIGPAQVEALMAQAPMR